MLIEEHIDILAPAATLFAIYAEVGAWHRWDPDTKSARLDGPLRVGAAGMLAPAQGFPVKMAVVEVEQDRSFTVECKAPLCVMRFEHVLTPLQGGAVNALHRVGFSGPLAGLFGRLVGTRVRRGLPATMASLKRYAEAQAPA